MTRVTGLGGMFFKAKDAKTLLAWYQKHLQLPPDQGGAVVFEWREVRKPDEKGRSGPSSRPIPATSSPARPRS